MSNHTQHTYKESQKINFWWVWCIIIAINGFNIYKVFQNPNDLNLWIALSILFLVSILILIMKLETTIDKKGIHYRMTPFHIKSRTIDWKDIQKVEVKKYNPIFEYGGWGIRGFKKRRAYSIYGTKGIYILLRNNNSIMIGTQNPENARQIIESIKSEYTL